MGGSQKLGGTLVIGVLVVLTLIAVGVARHPASVRGDGRNLLIFDLLLLLSCAIAGALIYTRGRRQVDIALDVAINVGFVLGVIHISNHLLESFGAITVRAARLALGAGHTLLMFALFAVAGSLSRQRTRSIGLAMLGGLGCALVGLLIALSFAMSTNLVFEQRVLLRLQQAFLASGMTDSGAFLVKNSLMAASEALVRMPLLALILSFASGLANATVGGQSRNTLSTLAWLIAIAFLAAATALWYADSVQREARPPFVMTGLLLAGIAVIFVHPVWSAMRGERVELR